MIANLAGVGRETFARGDELSTLREKGDQLLRRHAAGRARAEACFAAEAVDDSGFQARFVVRLVGIQHHSHDFVAVDIGGGWLHTISPSSGMWLVARILYVCVEQRQSRHQRSG